MQDKQKVTLYLPPGLHRQLKIRAALDTESMSSMVEKAVIFYLKHPEIVEDIETSHGKTYQVHVCPECDSSLIMEQGQMVSLKNQASVMTDDFPREVREKVNSQTQSHQTNSQGEEELITCFHRVREYQP